MLRSLMIPVALLIAAVSVPAGAAGRLRVFTATYDGWTTCAFDLPGIQMDTASGDKALCVAR